MFFWNSFVFSMIQWMLATWSLVPPNGGLVTELCPTLCDPVDVRECLTEDSYVLFLINLLFLISFCYQKPVEGHAAPRTEVIGWNRLESPSVNILLWTKLLSLDPLSWDMDCLLTLWPLLIPCSLGNGCCRFGFERLLLNHAKMPGFLAPGGEEFNPGPETRLDRSELV